MKDIFANCKLLLCVCALYMLTYSQVFTLDMRQLDEVERLISMR